MDKKEKMSRQQAAKCAKCGKEAVKYGTRKNKMQSVQRYKCGSCRSTFTLQQSKSITYPIQTILKSLSAYNLGYSLKQTQERIEKSEKMKVPLSTISRNKNSGATNSNNPTTLFTINTSNGLPFICKEEKTVLVSTTTCINNHFFELNNLFVNAVPTSSESSSTSFSVNLLLDTILLSLTNSSNSAFSLFSTTSCQFSGDNNSNSFNSSGTFTTISGILASQGEYYGNHYINLMPKAMKQETSGLDYCFSPSSLSSSEVLYIFTSDCFLKDFSCALSINSSNSRNLIEKSRFAPMTNLILEYDHVKFKTYEKTGRCAAA